METTQNEPERTGPKPTIAAVIPKQNDNACNGIGLVHVITRLQAG